MEKFDQYIHANMHLDIETKRAALKSSESVVSLVSRKGRLIGSIPCYIVMLYCSQCYAAVFHVKDYVYIGGTRDNQRYVEDLRTRNWKESPRQILERDGK